MKKTLLLSFVLLCGPLSFAATMPTVSATVPLQTNIAANTPDTTMESIERNIDRRLVYFNRYKRDNDMESLTKLISQRNKDFYMNFMKYVKVSPHFTLTRDTSKKIVKTPIDEYVISAIVSVDKNERQVSITFIEQKTAQWTKWLILDSNLHIQGSLPTTTSSSTKTNKGNNLTSNTLNNTTTNTTTTQTKTPNTSSITPQSSPSTVTLPVINKTPGGKTPEVSKNTLEQKNISQWVSAFTIIIVFVCLFLCILWMIFWILIRKKTQKKLATVAAAVAAQSIIWSVWKEIMPTTITPTEEIKTKPVPLTSNVTISRVDDVQNDATNPIIETENVIVSKTSSPEVSQEIAPISEDVPSFFTTPPTNAEEIKTIISEPVELLSPPTASEIVADGINSPDEWEGMAIQKENLDQPISHQTAIDISTETYTPDDEMESIKHILDESFEKTPEKESPMVAAAPSHALFENILNPLPQEPATHSLFEKILSSET